MDNIRNDNSLELIKKYKQELMDSTNIEYSPDEMEVIDNILFRMWQVGWLGTLDAAEKQGQALTIMFNRCIFGRKRSNCSDCGVRDVCENTRSMLKGFHLEGGKVVRDKRVEVHTVGTVPASEMADTAGTSITDKAFVMGSDSIAPDTHEP